MNTAIRVLSLTWSMHVIGDLILILSSKHVSPYPMHEVTEFPCY